MEKKENDFIVFCIETYKNKMNTSGSEVYSLFEKYKVIDYLYENYDMLHTEGAEWLINDIQKFLKNKGYSK